LRTKNIEPPPAPPAEVLTPAQAIKRKYKNPEEFFTATKAQRDRTGTTYRLYRLYPVIDRTLSGRQTKELDIAVEMDTEYIRRAWGSGDYEIYFHDANQKFSQVSKTILVLRDSEYPPVVDQAELVSGDPKNQGYIEQLKARNLWRGDGGAMQESPAAAAAVQQMGKIAADAMARANEPRDEQIAVGRSIEIMATGFDAAVKRIAASGGDNGGASDRLMDIVLKRMDQQHETMLAVLKQKNEPAAGGTVDGQIATVDKLMEFADRLSSRNGGSASPSWMDALLGRLPDLLTGLVSLMAMQRGAAAPATVPMYAAPGQPGAYAPGPFAPPAPAAVPSAAVPDLEVDETMLRSMGLPPEVGKIIKVGKRAVRAYQDGFSGSAFAESVDRLEGEQVYATIAQLGAAGILQVLRGLPPALLGGDAAVLQSPQLVPWIEEFCAYGEDPGDDSAGGPPVEVIR
jgi:hypothetical protein